MLRNMDTHHVLTILTRYKTELADEIRRVKDLRVALDAKERIVQKGIQLFGPLPWLTPVEVTCCTFAGLTG